MYVNEYEKNWKLTYQQVRVVISEELELGRRIGRLWLFSLYLLYYLMFCNEYELVFNK